MLKIYELASLENCVFPPPPFLSWRHDLIRLVFFKAYGRIKVCLVVMRLKPSGSPKGIRIKFNCVRVDILVKDERFHSLGPRRYTLHISPTMRFQGRSPALEGRVKAPVGLGNAERGNDNSELREPPSKCRMVGIA